MAVRLGIIGCGGVSHTHAAAAGACNSARIVAACDLNPEIAKRWSVQYGCEKVYSDYRQMIRNENLDGVILATWPILHREQIEGCIEAGIRSILCEKSLAMNSRQAVEIFELARRSEVLVMEGITSRHHPAMRRLEKVLLTEDLGRISTIHAVCNSYMPEPDGVPAEQRNWRHRKECGGGVNRDSLCYVVNACNYFAGLQGGAPVRAMATGSISHASKLITRISGLIEYDNGVIAHVEASFRSTFNQEFQLNATHGILDLPIAWTIYNDSSISYRHARARDETLTDIYRIPAADPFKLQLDNFAHAIRGEARPLITLQQSVVNIATIDALVASLKDRATTKVQLPEELQDEVLPEVDPSNG